MSTRAELLQGQSTLVCLLQGLQGKRLSLELKDGRLVRGVLQIADLTFGYAPLSVCVCMCVCVCVLVCVC